MTITARWYLGEFSALRTLEELVRSEDEAEALAGFGALEGVGRSLRVARLGDRPVLRLALWEAFRRNFPEESAQLRAAAALSAKEAAEPPPESEVEASADEEPAIEVLESGEAAAQAAPPEEAPEEASQPHPAGDPEQELKALQALEASYDVAAFPPHAGGYEHGQQPGCHKRCYLPPHAPYTLLSPKVDAAC